MRWAAGCGLLTAVTLTLLYDTVTFDQYPALCCYAMAGLFLLPPVGAFIYRHRSVIGVVVLVLALLNPSFSAFRHHAERAKDQERTVYIRQLNFFLFSIYRKEWPEYNGKVSSETYIGFLGNFWSEPLKNTRR